MKPRLVQDAGSVDDPVEGSPFPDSTAHLFAELERIDLMINVQVAVLRRVQSEDEQFRGLYISEQDIDALLVRPRDGPHWMVGDADDRERHDALLDDLDARTRARVRASADRGIPLRLVGLQERFGLDRFDVDALLICLAVELDLRYERIYAYLQDDVTRKRPSVDLVLNLLTSTTAQRLAGREHFACEAPLIDARLLELFEDPSQPRPPLLMKSLKVSDRIVAHLLGSDAFDERIRDQVARVVPGQRLADLLLDEATRRGLAGVAARSATGARSVLYLHGPQGIGKRTVAAAVCQAAGRPLLVADIDASLARGDDEFRNVLALVGREARLQGTALYWRGVDTLFAEGHTVLFRAFIAHCESASDLVFLGGELPWIHAGTLKATAFWSVDLPLPAAADQSSIWTTTLAGCDERDRQVDFSELAGKFRFTGGQIRRVVETARSLAWWRDPASGVLATADLHAACRLHSNQKLGSLARKVVTRSRWNDIVLPDDRVAQLREICNQVKYRDLVYGKWGFDRKLSMGKGLAALFAGPSGTGKTMAAEIVAGELGLDLYKIDLSTVVSKFIGETEKNLSRIFSEAETSNAILFFDEADALFGKRSEVRDSHDRYANIEVGYLLQRIEEYEGVVLLASNFRRNMDEAFVRRLHFTIDFPFPNQHDRLRIWTGIWPGDTPLDPDLDLPLLARKFEMAGGNIRNIALTAAFLAADDGGIVQMQHIVSATQREYQKMGKLVADGEFRVGAT